MKIGEPFSPYKAFTGVFIPDSLISFRGINAAEKICLARIFRYCGKKDHCWPSQEELAEELGVEVRSVHTYLNHLSEQGFIRIEQQGLGNPNIYTILGHQVFGAETGNNLPVQTGIRGSDPDRKDPSSPTYSTEENQTARESSSEEISSEDRPTSQSTIIALKAEKGLKFRQGDRAYIRENWTEELSEGTQEQACDYFREHLGKKHPKRNGFHRNGYVNGRTAAAVPVVAEVVSIDPDVQRDFDAYMDIPLRCGKPIGNAERKAAWPLFSPLDVEQRRATAKDYLRICMGTSDPKYMPTPANHLKQEPWTRIAIPRELPVLTENSKQAEKDRQWQESADRLRAKHAARDAAKAAREQRQ